MRIQRPSLNEVVIQVMSLKLDYLWCGSEEALIKFIRDGLQLAKTEAQQQKPSDEVFLLPVIGFIKFHTWTLGDPCRSQTYLLLALHLLEYVRDKIPSSQQGIALTVRLAHYLGFSSALLVNWASLRVRNVLVDPLSYLIVERLSTTQPHEFPKSSSNRATPTMRAPRKLLESILKENDESDSLLAESILQAFRTGKWHTVSDLQSARRRLNYGISHRTAVLERRRILRLGDEIYDGFGMNDFGLNEYTVSDMTDGRDMNALLNFEPSGGKTLQKLISNGPTTGAHWVVFHAIIDETDCILSEQMSKRLSGHQRGEYWERIKDERDKFRAELTDCEFASVPVWSAIHAASVHLDKGSKEPSKFTVLLKEVKQSLEDYKPASAHCVASVDEKPLLPDSGRLQALYLDLDLFKVGGKLVPFVKKRTKISQQDDELVRTIKTRIEEAHGGNTKFVRDWVKKLESYDLAQQLRKDALGVLVDDVLDQNLDVKSKEYIKDAVHALKSWLGFGEKAMKALARS